MPYWIHRDGENVGPYDLLQLREMLAAGQITAEDLAIEEGSSEWSSVGSLADAAPEPMMAELVSHSVADEPMMATPEPALEIAGAGGGKLKFAIIGVVALLVIGVVALLVIGGDGEGKDQAKNNPGDNGPKPPPAKNTPQPGGNKPDAKLPELPPNPGNPLPGPNTNSPPPLLPPPPLPPLNPGGNALAQRPMSDAVRHIPVNTIGVMSIDVGQLLKKSGGFEALMEKAMQAAGPEANNPMVKALAGLLAPDKLAANFGVAMNQPLHVFVTSDLKVGLLLSVADAKKLEMGISNVAVMLKAPLPELQAGNGFKLLAMPQQAAAVALGPSALMVLVDSQAADLGEPKDLTQDIGRLMGLPGAATGQLAQVSPYFAKHMQVTYDGALWMNVKELMKVAANQMPPEASEALGDPDLLGERFEMAGGVSFQQGRVIAKVSLGYDEKLLGDWSSGANLAAGVLGAIPGDAPVVLTQSMNMKVMRPFIEARVPKEAVDQANAVLANFDLDLKTLLELPAGDMAFSWVGLDDHGDPKLLFSMNVTDPAKVGGLLQKLNATPVYAEIQQGGYELILKGSQLHIAPMEYKGALESGLNKTPLNPGAQKLLAEHDTALYVNPTTIGQLLATQGVDAGQVLQQFRGIHMTGTAEPDSQHFTAIITMADPNANVLQVLVNQLFQAAMEFQNDGGFPDPTSPTPFPPGPNPFPQPPPTKGGIPLPPQPPPIKGIEPLPPIKGNLPILPPPAKVTEPPPAPKVPEVNPFDQK